MKIENIFAIKGDLPTIDFGERFETLHQNGSLKIERIISAGHLTPEGYWYEQELAEWVILLQGEADILFDNSDGTCLHLVAGDYLYIEPMRRHRVVNTTENPPCIWLAIHGC